MAFHVPEAQRVVTGPMRSSQKEGNNGVFMLRRGSRRYCVIASDGMGWDHVSVHIDGERRCPRWDEMCWLKDIFWDETDAVIQIHPAKANHVNNHEFTLHLWRCTSTEQPLPPVHCV